MKIDAIARNMRLYGAVKETFEKKLGKLEKVLPKGAQARVVVFAEKKGIKVEVTIAARQRTWTAEAVAEDQLGAAQEAMDRIAAQVKKTKAIVKERKKHAPSGVRSPQAWRETRSAEPEAPVAPTRSEAVLARPMFEEDALNAFGGDGREVLVYRDLSDEHGLRVLYRRRDGGVGLLVPK